MSTLGQPNLEASWKEEVNRRIAAHKNRKGGAEQPQRPAPAAAMNSRAAEAAARVAARYAAAPTYTQMQAEEARVVVRAAQIATKVALEAQAAAESVLAELHAATVPAPAKPSRGPAVIESIARTAETESACLPFADEAPTEIQSAQIASDPMALTNSESHAAIAEPVVAFDPEVAVAVGEPEIAISVSELELSFAPAEEDAALEIAPEPTHQPIMLDRDSLSVRWDADLPSRTIELPVAGAPAPAHEEFTLAAEDWWTPAQVSDSLRNEPLEVNTQPAQANLIHFPRELVATRKMRPRLGEPTAAQPVEGQLSIFEVDPGAVSTTPEIEPATVYGGSAYTAPGWSGMQLDAQPEQAQRPATTPQSGKRPDVAPFSRHLMTYVVDGTLILAVVCGVAMVAVSNMARLPEPRTAEVLAAIGLAVTAILYHAAFFGFGLGTPGMHYAGVAFSTFNDDVATAAQTRRRLGAMLLSALPFGLGFLWALFDDDSLGWHDRISGTYMRKKM